MPASGNALAILVFALALVLAVPAPAQNGVLGIASPGFKDGDKLPRTITCDGGDHSPALSISGVPAHAKSLAVLMTEQNPAKDNPTLWMAYNFPPSPPAIPENQPKTRALKHEAMQLPASNGKMGYSGPCLPPGPTRRYVIEVFALDTLLTLPDQADRRAFLSAVEGHILARGRLTGRYKK